jgi:hypothetical protein
MTDDITPDAAVADDDNAPDQDPEPAPPREADVSEFEAAEPLADDEDGEQEAGPAEPEEGGGG